MLISAVAAPPPTHTQWRGRGGGIGAGLEVNIIHYGSYKVSLLFVKLVTCKRHSLNTHTWIKKHPYQTLFLEFSSIFLIDVPFYGGLPTAYQFTVPASQYPESQCNSRAQHENIYNAIVFRLRSTVPSMVIISYLKQNYFILLLLIK